MTEPMARPAIQPASGDPTPDKVERMAQPSSFMISHFLTGLSHVMPDAEQAKLDPYQQAAAQAGSDSTAEWHRAYRCAKWARDIVVLPTHGSLASLVRRGLEIVKQVEETIGSELTDLLEIPLGLAVSPKFEVEIAWVYEAVHVAEGVAAETGWEGVPWETLVRDMLAITGT